MTEVEATLRIEARFKNARLYNAICAQAVPVQSTSPAGAAIQARGPIKPWCDFHGIQVTTVYDLLNLKRGPLRTGNMGKAGGVRDICQHIAALLERDVAWLFPEDLYNIKWPRLATDVPHERFISLGVAPRHVFELPPIQENNLLQNELRQCLAGAVDTLTPREARVIRMRFGLDGDEHTLEETGRSIGANRERVRQIEAKALRKLRHPVRSRKLLPFIEAVAGPAPQQTSQDTDEKPIASVAEASSSPSPQVYISQDVVDALLREGERLLESLTKT